MPDFEGLLSCTDIVVAARLAEYARRLEQLGYCELWIPDPMGRETFVTAGYSLANTTRLRVASGIASVHGRARDRRRQDSHRAGGAHSASTPDPRTAEGAERRAALLPRRRRRSRPPRREHPAAGATRVPIFDFDPRPESAPPPAVAPGRASQTSAEREAG